MTTREEFMKKLLLDGAEEKIHELMRLSEGGFRPKEATPHLQYLLHNIQRLKEYEKNGGI